jgi:DNA-nicking Smr family endonuclease
MNKYEQVPERIVDLHGLTKRETEEVLDILLIDAQGSHVRLIVGKGVHSAQGAVLREFVKIYLGSRNITFHQSKLQYGGEGALEVFL